MRLSAVWTIGELDYDGGETILRQVAEQDPQEKVRAKAVQMLGVIEERRNQAGDEM